MCILGNDKDEVKQSLYHGDMNFISLDDEKYSDFGNVKVGKICEYSNEVEDCNSYDKSEIMARKVIDATLKDAGITKDYFSQLGSKAAMSLATSIMGSDYIQKYVSTGKKELSWLLKAKSFPSRLMKEYNIRGGCYTTSSACSSGTAGFGIAYDLVKSGRANCVLIGGVDHISDISLFGFHSLDTLSHNICKPFDQQRDGINIGEGCAFFILEDYDSAIKRNAHIYAEVVGYGLGNDAYHITSPDPEGIGAQYTMKMALKEANYNYDEPIYVNAHGTGTRANDSMELLAIQDVFHNNLDQVYISSTKSMTGHCLGAAGCIEGALSLIILGTGMIPKTCNSETDLLEQHNLNKHLEQVKQLNYVISNSFAFGGNDASVVFKKIVQ